MHPYSRPQSVRGLPCDRSRSLSEYKESAVREADPRSRGLRALNLTCRPRALLRRCDLIGACSSRTRESPVRRGAAPDQ